jgi:uncharacterized membrane protein YgcG
MLFMLFMLFLFIFISFSMYFSASVRQMPNEGGAIEAFVGADLSAVTRLFKWSNRSGPGGQTPSDSMRQLKGPLGFGSKPNETPLARDMLRVPDAVVRELEAKRPRGEPPPPGLTETCLHRARLVLLSAGSDRADRAYDVALRPMRCFPDPDIVVDYELRCVCHFDTCRTCGDDALCGCVRRSSWDGGSGSDSDAGSGSGDEGGASDGCGAGEGEDECPAIMKVALLRLANDLAQRERGVCWAAVRGGAGTHVVNHRFDGSCRNAHGRLPDASDLEADNEFGRCSYGTGCAYAAVAFHGHPELDFTFAVTGIDHDT